MLNANEVGPHGLRLAPRLYRISFAAPGGGISRMVADGYSIEDAIRRLRKSGVRIPAALIHNAKCIGQRDQPQPTGIDPQRLYDAARNLDWDDPAAVAAFEAAVAKARVDNVNAKA